MALINLDSGVVGRQTALEPSDDPAFASSKVQFAVSQALKGELPRSKDLRVGQVETLKMSHIQIIFDHALGYTNKEIAMRHEVTLPTIINTVKHPDAEYILGVIAGEMGDRLTDPIERFKATAGEAANEIIGIMRSTKNEPLKRKAALDILEIAGYGKKKVIDVNETHTLNLPAPIAQRLADSLAQSNTAKDIDYAEYTVIPSPAQLGDGSDGVPIPVSQAGPDEQSLVRPPGGDSLSYNTKQRVA